MGSRMFQLCPGMSFNPKPEGSTSSLPLLKGVARSLHDDVCLAHFLESLVTQYAFMHSQLVQTGSHNNG